MNTPLQHPRLLGVLRPLLFLALLAGCQDQDRSASEGSSLPAPAAPSTAPPGGPDDAPPPSDPPTPSAPDDDLTAGGWGNLRIGMTRAELVAAAGEDANPQAVGGPDPATCDEFRPSEAPDGLLVMVRNGRLSRIAVVDGPDMETPEGFRVGDGSAAVKEAYGARAAESTHPFLSPPAEYITIWATAPPGPDVRGIVYEIGVDGRIVRILAGDESVQASEGCV